MDKQHTWGTTAQVAKLLGVTPQCVRGYLRAGRVRGAYKVHRQMWIIPLFSGMPIIESCRKGPKPRWKTPRRPPKVRVHVNQTFLRHNKKHPDKEPLPIFAIETYKEKIYAEGVRFNGISELVYRPDKGLGCGAVAWVQTYDSLELLGKTAAYEEIDRTIRCSPGEARE